jgi:hypothetical protein
MCLNRGPIRRQHKNFWPCMAPSRKFCVDPLSIRSVANFGTYMNGALMFIPPGLWSTRSIFFQFWRSYRPAEGRVEAKRRQLPGPPRRPRTAYWRSQVAVHG